MSEHPVTRAARLLSHGQLLTPLVDAVPERPGTPRIIANGLGRYFVGRPVLNAEQRLTYEYASDPERVLELAATRIRRERFNTPTFDYTRVFPVTRRLAYAAFEDTRPKTSHREKRRMSEWNEQCMTTWTAQARHGMSDKL